jgi:hypothetical protein
MAKDLNPERIAKVWNSTAEIKNQLRDIVLTRENRPCSSKESVLTSSPNYDLPVVVTKRQSGKTMGLAHFIGERTLILSETDTIGVVTPTENIGMEFLRQFRTHFPTLKEPVVVPISSASTRLHGHRFREIYVEEVFAINPSLLSDICAHYPVVAAIGTIEAPTTITIRV